MRRRILTIVVSAAIATGYLATGASAEDPGNAAGAKVFAQNCAVCHGQDGKGTSVAPGLSGMKDRQFILQRVKEGAGIMPSFSNKLTPDQIRAVVDYVAAKAAK